MPLQQLMQYGAVEEASQAQAEQDAGRYREAAGRDALVDTQPVPLLIA
jgi:hypothetical protein